MEQKGRNNRRRTDSQVSQNRNTQSDIQRVQKNQVNRSMSGKPKGNSDTKNMATLSQRLRNILLVFFLVLVLLVGRLGWLQIVQGAELKEAMYNQLTTSRVISPKRGAIYDSTGKALARSFCHDGLVV